MDAQAEDGVYTGFLTRLFTNAGISTPYYTYVMRALRTMRCVEQLKRGGGKSPSKWRMVSRPTSEAWASQEGKPHTVKPYETNGSASTAQRIRDLTARIERLEKAQNS